MRKVNFVIGGAPKAGSTSLAKMVGRIQNCYLYDPGFELQFFGKDKIYKKGIDWYNNHFQGREEPYIGEKSTSYLLHPEAAQRIKDYNPDMKIIFILRNPVYRAYSQYKQNIANGTEYFSFEKAIRKESNRRKLGGFFANNYAYKYRGFYYHQLKQYYDRFPEDQIMVVIFKDFKADPKKTLREVCDFLDIPYAVKAQVKESVHSNRTRVPRMLGVPIVFMVYRKYIRNHLQRFPWLTRQINALESLLYKDTRYEQMPDELREELQKEYAESNKELEELLGRDLSHWNE